MWHNVDSHISYFSLRIGETMSFFSLDNPAVILETVKMVWDTVFVGKHYYLTFHR